MDLNQSAGISVGERVPRHKIGEPFRPYRHFEQFAVVPEPLCKYRGLGAGAKLAWVRLARYEGKSGGAFPSIPTLAGELGIGATQARAYVQELVRGGFIKVEQKSGTSSRYSFLWHPAFDGETGETRKTPPLRKTGGVVVRKTGGVTPAVNRRAPLRKTGDEESQGRESSSRESIEESQVKPSVLSGDPPNSPKANTPETASDSLRADDDENLEPPERLRRWIERKHPRPAENPEEQTAADIVALVQQDLTEKGHALDAEFFVFVRSRATGKAKNRAGLYRKLAREYAAARQAKVAEQSFAIVQAIKHGLQERHVHKCPKCGSTDPEGGMVLTESGFGFCECATAPYRERNQARIDGDNARRAEIRAKKAEVSAA